MVEKNFFEKGNFSLRLNAPMNRMILASECEKLDIVALVNVCLENFKDPKSCGDQSIFTIFHPFKLTVQ